MRDGRGDLRVLVVDAAGALEHLRKVRALSPVGTDGGLGECVRGCHDLGQNASTIQLRVHNLV